MFNAINERKRLYAVWYAKWYRENKASEKIQGQVRIMICKRIVHEERLRQRIDGMKRKLAGAKIRSAWRTYKQYPRIANDHTKKSLAAARPGTLLTGEGKRQQKPSTFEQVSSTKVMLPRQGQRTEPTVELRREQLVRWRESWHRWARWRGWWWELLVRWLQPPTPSSATWQSRECMWQGLSWGGEDSLGQRRLRLRSLRLSSDAPSPSVQ